MVTGPEPSCSRTVSAVSHRTGGIVGRDRRDNQNSKNDASRWQHQRTEAGAGAGAEEEGGRRGGGGRGGGGGNSSNNDNNKAGTKTRHTPMAVTGDDTVGSTTTRIGAEVALAGRPVTGPGPGGRIGGDTTAHAITQQRGATIHLGTWMHGWWWRGGGGVGGGGKLAAGAAPDALTQVTPCKHTVACVPPPFTSLHSWMCGKQNTTSSRNAIIDCWWWYLLVTPGSRLGALWPAAAWTARTWPHCW
jgi:hypothetical protein